MKTDGNMKMKTVLDTKACFRQNSSYYKPCILTGVVINRFD